jgi:transposase-like protein
MTYRKAPHVPPFCPNPTCPFHSTTDGWIWIRNGFFSRDASPQRIQRYRCRHCGLHFSEQTFSTTYWLRRPKLQIAVFRGLISCSCLRQIARANDCSPQTVALHANRIGRHCMLFQELHRPKQIEEPSALDGIQSFEYSQFHPDWFHVLAGRPSHFCYVFTVSELRRSGTMTAAQKRKRRLIEEQHGRPDPAAIEKDTAELIAIACPEPQELDLTTDEHPAYPRAFKRVPHVTVHHHTISSRAARTTSNPLFVINLLDLLIRHSGSEHKRETIAFAKRRQMSIWRLCVMLVWRNFMKWVSERRHEDTPAMRLGIMQHRLRPRQLFAQRLFVSQIPLPERWRQYYFGKVVTRMVPNGREHTLRYAA